MPPRHDVILTGFAFAPDAASTRPAKHELHDSSYRVVGTLRLVDADAADGPDIPPVPVGGRPPAS